MSALDVPTESDHPDTRSSMSISSPLLIMHSVYKAFPGVQALDDVNFDVLPGEIHALVGENGAGKTTLMRILSGEMPPDSGSISWNSRPVEVQSPAAAQALGISVIHQELAVVPYLDVGTNIFLGREPGSRLPWVIDWAGLYREAEKQLERLGLDLDPRTPVNQLTIAQQQMVEVVKALSLDASLIVMDEPTSALTEREVEALFAHMVRLKEQGVSIVFISHRLEEVFRIADRLTVLRDGGQIGTHSLANLSEDEVVRMMVGREVTLTIDRTRTAEQEVVLRVEDLWCGDEVRGVSFELHRGEILGFAGLVGAGRTALMEAIFGARKTSSGRLWIEGEPVEIRTPAHAIDHGLGFVPENRKEQGLFLNMAVGQNIVMAALKRLSRFGILRRRAIREFAGSLVERLDIRTAGLDQRVRNLSGGNQQKVIIARWLGLEPKILILDEPTRGIDVGAKSEVHALLNQTAAIGQSVLMVSSELPEVLGLSDRILVMTEGELVAELDPKRATPDDVMSAAARSHSVDERS